MNKPIRTGQTLSLLTMALAVAIAAQANLSPPIPEYPVPAPPWRSGATTVTLDRDGTFRVSGNGPMADYHINGFHGKHSEWYRHAFHSVWPFVSAVVIDEGVTYIGDFAFAKLRALTSVAIPASVSSIGQNAFMSCDRLVSITVATGNAHYTCEDGILFNKNKTTLVRYPPKPVGNDFWADTSDKPRYAYVIPPTVTAIGEDAFSDAILTSVTIPNSVTAIRDHAFSGCPIRSVTIPNSVTVIGNYAFVACMNLTSVTIPNSVTVIGKKAFAECINLTSVTIPGSVKAIKEEAFAGADKLKSVTIEDGVESIGHAAFAGCRSLTSLTIPRSVAFIGYGVFFHCYSDSVLSITALNPKPPTVNDYAFQGHNLNNVWLYVPANAVKAYTQAPVWGQFERIRPIASEKSGPHWPAICAVSVLTALILSVAAILIIKKTRKSHGLM